MLIDNDYVFDRDEYYYVKQRINDLVFILFELEEEVEGAINTNGLPVVGIIGDGVKRNLTGYLAAIEHVFTELN